MTKKLLLILLALTLIFAIIACAPENNNNENQGGTNQNQNAGDTDQNQNAGDTDQNQGDADGQDGEDNQANEGTYKDGTYEAEGDEWEHGQENATVVIEDGQIFDITLRRLDNEGNEVDYENWTGEERNGQLYPNLKQFKEDMADRMIEQQTYEVDAIAGATVTTQNWKLAVQRALEKATQ